MIISWLLHDDPLINPIIQFYFLYLNIIYHSSQPSPTEQTPVSNGYSLKATWLHGQGTMDIIPHHSLLMRLRAALVSLGIAKERKIRDHRTGVIIVTVIIMIIIRASIQHLLCNSHCSQYSVCMKLLNVISIGEGLPGLFRMILI